MAKKATIIIAALIIGVLVLAGIPLLLQVTADTTGRSVYYKGWNGNSISAGAPQDLLDATAYVTSWDSRGMSEKIFLYAYVLPNGFPIGDGPTHCVWNDHWFKITVEGGGAATFDYWGQRFTTTSWETAHHWEGGAQIKQKVWYTIEGDSFKIIGPYVGKVHVELWANHDWSDIPFVTKHGTTMFASDEAYLQSGSGSVVVPPYTEEGTDMVLKVSTGYSGNHGTSGDTDGPGGWLLRIFDRTGALVPNGEKTIPDKSSGFEVRYRVPLGSFTTTVGANNNWKVELWNMLFIQHQEYTVVIKQGTAAILPPGPQVISMNGDPPWPAGTTLTWKLEGKENPAGFDLAGFRYSVQYSPTAGQLMTFIVENQWVIATPSATKNNTWTATVTGAAPQTGFYVLSAQSIDVQNNPSVFTKLEYEVGPAGTDGATIDTWDWLALIIGLIALIGGCIIGIIIIMNVPPPYGLVIGLLIIIVGFAVGGYYLYSFVTDATEKGLLVIGTINSLVGR